jgi:hypothetical protein
MYEVKSLPSINTSIFLSAGFGTNCTFGWATETEIPTIRIAATENSFFMILFFMNEPPK